MFKEMFHSNDNISLPVLKCKMRKAPVVVQFTLFRHAELVSASDFKPDADIRQHDVIV